MMNEKDNFVTGWGPEYSPLMIISDYPTVDEIKNKRALSGASGSLIGDLLKQNKYHIDKCYKTTYIKCALSGFNSKNKRTSREALEQVHTVSDWGKSLIEEISNIKPNVILALGELTLNFLTEEKNINRYRGSVLPLSPNLRHKIGLECHIRVVPVLHPRDIFPNPLSYVYTQLDYAKAIKNIHATRAFEEPGIIWIARNAESLIEYWKRARHGEFLVTDIETFNNFPTCASLCTDGQETVSFPLYAHNISLMENVCLVQKYADILRSGIPKVNQNMKYDWTVLERLGFTINNIVGDTMLAANVIYPELPKGLDFLASIYTDISYYKDEGKDYDPKLHDFDRMLYYNAKDSLATWRVWKSQQKDMEELNVKNFYFNFIHPLFFHYKKVDDRGIKVDGDKQLKLIDKYENLLATHSAELNTVYGKELNVRSPKQVGQFIYEYLNCPVHTHLTPNGNESYSTDEDTIVNIYLNEVQDDIVRKVLRQIILCRKIENALNILQTPFHSDYRMRTSYNPAGTTTGRTTTSQAIGWFFCIEDGKIKQTRYGTAFQKLPKHGFEFEGEIFGEDIREMFVPTPGYEFFAFDGSNAEGRVVCILAEDYDTLDYIEAGNDIHKLTASWIYEKPIEYIKKPERDIGKRARHAGHLGQTGAGLSPQVYKSIKFCNSVMAKFHSKAPKIQNVFQLGIQRLIEKNRLLINPFGRRRDFFNYDKRNKYDTFKEAYSYIPQGTVSDHFKQIALNIAEIAPWSYHIFEAHDGLMYEIPNGRRDEFAQLAYEISSKSISFKDCSMPRDRELNIPIEMEYSQNNWYDMQSYKLIKEKVA